MLASAVTRAEVNPGNKRTSGSLDGEEMKASVMLIDFASPEVGPGEQ